MIELIIVHSRTDTPKRTVNHGIACFEILQILSFSIFDIGENKIAVFFEFAVAAGQFPVTVGIYSLCTVKGMTVLQSHTATHFIGIAANCRRPMAVRRIFDISQTRKGIVFLFLCSRVICKSLFIRCQLIVYFDAVIDLRIGIDVDMIIPRIVIFLAQGIAVTSPALAAETHAGITAENYIACFIFQRCHANSKLLQFVCIFISQAMNQRTLFHRCRIHMSHRFCCHFSGFIACNRAPALKILAINTLNNTRVSQRGNRLVRPTVCRNIYKRICRPCAYRPHCHSHSHY